MSSAVHPHAYSSALENISDGCTPSALAMRKRLSAVTLRSPRSILPMWDRSIPALCANASCDTRPTLRTSRTAWPNALRRRSLSAVRGLLDTAAPSQCDLHCLGTLYAFTIAYPSSLLLRQRNAARPQHWLTRGASCSRLQIQDLLRIEE